MTPFLKISLLATAMLGATSLTASAQTVVVPLEAPAATIVGTTTTGNLVVQSSTYLVVLVPSTDAAIAEYNAIVLAAAPGPHVGWAVTSADEMPLGTVSYSVQDSAGNITSFDLLMPDGRGVRMTNAISKMGDNELLLRINKADLVAGAVAPFTIMDVQ